MTAIELKDALIKDYGINSLDWPEQLAVSAATYGHVCNQILTILSSVEGKQERVGIWIGRAGGVMFLNVELCINDDLEN